MSLFLHKKITGKYYTPFSNYGKINTVCSVWKGGVQMKNVRGKNGWILLLLMLAGIVVGGLLGTLTKDVSSLSWLNYGQSFGLDSPIVLNLGIIIITFGLNIKITVASIIGLIIGGFAYRFI